MKIRIAAIDNLIEEDIPKSLLGTTAKVEHIYDDGFLKVSFDPELFIGTSEDINRFIYLFNPKKINRIIHKKYCSSIFN